MERELAERDKMATLGHMAATVAHNIKNPLSSIKTIVQLMQEDGEVQNKYARDLSLIKSDSDVEATERLASASRSCCWAVSDRPVTG